MKKQKTSAMERNGIEYVRSIVEKETCIFHEIALRNDFGNDAFVEIVDNEIVTGVSIALQIKSGKSYCRICLCYLRDKKPNLFFIRVVLGKKLKRMHSMSIDRDL